MMMNLPCLRGSCPNFLRTIYHTPSASQAPRRGHAPRKKPMPATALVFIWLLLTYFHLQWYWFTQWTRYHHIFPLVFLMMQSVSDSIVYGFLFQNPAQPPMPIIRTSAEFWNRLLIFSIYAAACDATFTGCLISFNSFFGSYVVPVFRIV